MVGETLLIGLTLFIMLGVLVISLIPFVPGPALMWVVSIVFGFLNNFERLSVPMLLVITAVMIIGSTTDFWMPVLGMRAQGASCWSSLGTLIGGIIGTFIIPLPICGTFIGAIAGALLFEFIHIGDARLAFTAGRSAAKVFVLGLAVELAASIIIFLLFVVNVLLL